MMWTEVRKAMEANDSERIEELKQIVMADVKRTATKQYLKRLAVQSIYAASMGDVLSALKDNENDLIAHFQNQILMSFAIDHGLTVYTDPKKIEPGDSVVTCSTSKNKKTGKTIIANRTTLRVIERQEKDWLVSLAMWENDEVQFKAHERSETITKKNFLVGVRQAVPPIMKKPQKFYFINFPD